MPFVLCFMFRFMNDHDITMFDVVKRSNHLKVQDTAAAGSDHYNDEFGVAVKTDSVNCVSEIHWLKSGNIEKISSFDLLINEFSMLGEIVIKRPRDHMILSPYDGDDEVMNAGACANILARNCSVAFMDDNYQPTGHHQESNPCYQPIVALSTDMLDMSHVTQFGFEMYPEHGFELTHLSAKLQVGAIVALDAVRPNMVQVRERESESE
jgi:hypothetical protein